jgi:hypothetical protein
VAPTANANTVAYHADLMMYSSLAYAEMRLILARILFNFDIELADPSDEWLNQRVFAIWEKPPLMVLLKPVTQ